MCVGCVRDVYFDLQIFLVFTLFWFSPEKVAPIVKEMLGHSLITNQTPKSGVKVRQVVKLFLLLSVRRHSR